MVRSLRCFPVFPEGQFGEKAFLLLAHFGGGHLVKTFCRIPAGYLQPAVAQGDPGIFPGLFKGFRNGQVHFTLAGVNHPNLPARAGAGGSAGNLIRGYCRRGRGFGDRFAGVNEQAEICNQLPLQSRILVMVKPVCVLINPGLALLADDQHGNVLAIALFGKNLVFMTILQAGLLSCLGPACFQHSQFLIFQFDGVVFCLEKFEQRRPGQV